MARAEMSAGQLVADIHKSYALPMQRWLLIASIIVWGSAPVIAGAIVLLTR
jgi:hypothetical protein